MIKASLRVLLPLVALLVLLLPPFQAAAAPPEAHLLFTGDIMVGRYVNARMVELGFDWPFADIRGYLSAADITMGNLEGPLVPTDRYRLPTPATEEYNLSGDVRAAGGIARAGFDIMSVANNHTYDSGVDGLGSTVTALTNAGVAASGLDDATGQQAIIKTVRGLRIAFLSYNAVQPNIGAARSGSKPFVTYLNPASAVQRTRLSNEVARARLDADVVVVMFHWGVEYVTKPNAAQRQLAEIATRAGADLIVGAHPHVVQGLEQRGTAARPTIAAYSLGNSLFDQSLQAETRQGFILDVVVDAAGVKTVRLVPTEVRKRSGGHTMQLADDATGQPTVRRAVPSSDPRLLRTSSLGIDIFYRR